MLIRRHPLLSFFALSYLLSWLAWSPFVLGGTGLGIVPIRVPEVWGSAQTLGVMPGSFVGPIGAAFLVTALSGGRPALRRWGARLIRLRVGWHWYAAVLVGVPVVYVLATLLLPGGWEALRPPTLGLLLAYVPMLLAQLATTGLAEEPGWRDFALPLLQRRFGPFAGTLVVGTLWGAWHLPLFFTGWAGWPDVTIRQFGEFMLAAIALSIVMTWLFNRTGESLPIVMLFHCSLNSVASLVWAPMFPTMDAGRDSLTALLIASMVLAVVCIVATRGRLGYRSGAATAAEAAQPESSVASNGVDPDLR
ncbi:CPBP family intramembrane glutamic endopeptidase [Pseudonocardia sp. TRM90224]|uniref:CPBP family intramembrane glutamic endopeptidase n=1 Tax=Pseudonocardia sp. TRM90224 TaxID=2812678 RepID=UPI001E2B21D5|nr:type II CAAX endopeptidase family protein [Pseudonocardia sp. TRM90224]